MGEDCRIRLLVVDDHELIRQGIVHVFQGEPNICVVGEAQNAGEALEGVARLAPTVLLTDIKLAEGDRDGIALAEEVKQKHPDVKILLISMYEDEAYIERAITVGVHGYLLKDIHKETLLKAVVAVTHGDTFMDSRITQRLMRQYAHLKEHKRADAALPSPLKTLSPREMEVVTHLARGLSNKEIAVRMSVSEQTVKTHIYNVYRKLEVGNRIELTLYAIRTGLVEAEVPANREGWL